MQKITPYAQKSCFKFLDDSHLLVLFDEDLCIYDFASPTSSPDIQDPSAPPLPIEDCPCVLRMPPFAHNGIHSWDPKLCMQSSSSSSPTTAPLFSHDPALKIVCVTKRLLSTAREDILARAAEDYMFVISISALLSQFQRVRMRDTAPVSNAVPWEHWGPPSCRVFKTSVDFNFVGVSGTKVVMSRELDWDSGGRRARVLLQVVDVNPFAVTRSGGRLSASVDPPSESGSTPTASQPESRDQAQAASAPLMADPGEGGCIANCRFFRGGVVRSEVPYTMAAHEVELELEAGADADVERSDGRHELFVFEDQWVLVSVELSSHVFSKVSALTIRYLLATSCTGSGLIRRRRLSLLQRACTRCRSDLVHVLEVFK